MPERLEDTLRRLEQEREEADRRYNDALTALDRARPSLDPLQPSPQAYDEDRLPALNDAWNIIPGPPSGTGLKSRIAGLIWRAVAPYFHRQLTFNSLLVHHLNRTTEAAREAKRAGDEREAALAARLAALNDFMGHLLLYLQQITAYVDTRDRSSASGALVLNAAISGMADNLEKRWESLNARFESSTDELRSSQQTLRSAVAVAQQASMSLKRELERLAVSPPISTAATATGAAGTEAPASTAFSPALDSFKYVGFEDQFRGSRETIRRGLQGYLPLFRDVPDVLDVGCGRGEFLELLAGAGMRGRGIDVNHEMIEVCRERGLDVIEADAVGYLSSLADGSVGGIFSAQVVEHLQPGYLLRFLELAFHKVRPGGLLVIETLNPACWVAFFDSFIRDITHVWPLHPDTLKYLVLASGFTSAEVEYRSPVGEQHKLQAADAGPNPGKELSAIVEAFNENVEKLNGRLFTCLDYAVMARKQPIPFMGAPS